jgi:hypothetical protein
MEHFQLLAQPWWVDLLIFIPLVAFARWRSHGIEISRRQLFFSAVFALAFAFVESAVVVYLRAAIGLLPGYAGTLSDVQRLMRENANYPPQITVFPSSLLTVEVIREAATIVMLVSIAILAAGRARERWAMFLWMFALWDMSYYAGLWATIRWPASLTDLDVLFLIPVPWLAQVWFPLLVSGLTALVVVLSRKDARASRGAHAES